MRDRCKLCGCELMGADGQTDEAPGAHLLCHRATMKERQAIVAWLRDARPTIRAATQETTTPTLSTRERIMRDAARERPWERHTCGVVGIAACPACQLDYLAPSMAEAILRVTDEAERNVDGPGVASDEAVEQLHDVAEKLREIGASDD